MKFEEGFNANTILESLEYGTKVATFTFAMNGTEITSDVATGLIRVSLDKTVLKCVLDFYYINGPYSSP